MGRKQNSKRQELVTRIHNNRENISQVGSFEVKKRSNGEAGDEDPALTSAESKVLAGVWLQTVGSLLEAVGVTEELQALQAESIEEDNDFSMEKQAVAGVWLQTIGTALGAIGFMQELLPSEKQQIQGRKLGIIGSWFEAYGASLEALGETQLLKEDLEEDVPF